ncbi:MAG: GntR family transcriptional regulator [Bacteroidota bacterium]
MEFRNGKSIFLQIADSITDKVVNGEYAAGEKIPSVRELAAQMGVNPNTIMRTYSELQSMEIIENRRGIGYFVNAEAQPVILAAKRKEFFDDLVPEFVEKAQLLGIEYPEIESHLAKTFKSTK